MGRGVTHRGGVQAVKGPERREKILAFIGEFSRIHGHGPTLREIGAGVGLRSPASVHKHVVELQRRGLVRGPRSGRVEAA